MDALDNIFSRVSVRAYTDKRISEDAIHTILQAAMSGPSCVNSRDWSFIVVQNRETLQKMAAGNGKPAAPLFTADAAVLICGDLTRAHSRCRAEHGSCGKRLRHWERLAGHMAERCPHSSAGRAVCAPTDPRSPFHSCVWLPADASSAAAQSLRPRPRLF